MLPTDAIIIFGVLGIILLIAILIVLVMIFCALRNIQRNTESLL